MIVNNIVLSNPHSIGLDLHREPFYCKSAVRGDDALERSEVESTYLLDIQAKYLPVQWALRQSGHCRPTV